MPKIDQIRKQAEFWEFVKWMALPTSERTPATQLDLAEQLKVDNATLSDWKKVEGFWDEVRKLRKTWLQEKISNILLAVYGKSLEGDTSAAKLLLEYAREFEPSLRLVQETEVSPEEVEKVIKKLQNAGIITRRDNQKPSQEENSGVE